MQMQILNYIHNSVCSSSRLQASLSSSNRLAIGIMRRGPGSDVAQASLVPDGRLRAFEVTDLERPRDDITPPFACHHGEVGGLESTRLPVDEMDEASMREKDRFRFAIYS